MRRASLVAVGAVLLLVLAGSSPGAGGTDWKHLNYFIYETQEMLITTDGTWENAKAVAAGPHQAAPPPFDTRVKLTRIWAPTCLPGHQTVSFTKTFMAPGHPFSGSLYLDPSLAYPKPFHSMSVLINGRTIGHLGDMTSGKTAQGISAELPPEALTAFHYGLNKVTIRADKVAFKKGEACNKRTRVIGITSMLRLRFEPDLEALPSPKGHEQVVRSQAGSVVGTVGLIRFTNHGPSGSTGGKLIFRIAGNVNVETAWTPTTLQVQPPFHDCVGQGIGVAVVGTITCEYADFPAGLNSSIAVITGGRLTPGFRSDSTTSLTVDWQIVPAGYETNAANDSYSVKFIICGQTATAPECLGAK